MVAKDYADKVTGANDYMAGFNDQTVGTAATVGGTMFLAQQANSILNSILQNAEMAISNIYQIALFQCMANKDLLDLSFLSQEDQVLLQQIFAMNVEQIPTQFQFKVEATDITKTEESKKQAYLAMTQTYSMYAEKGFQLLQVMQQVGALQNPQLMADFAQSVFVGSTEFMKNMLDFFDVGDPEEYLPFVDDMKLRLQMMDRQKAAQVAAMKQQFLAQTNNNNAAAPQATAASLGVGTNSQTVGGVNGQGEVRIGAGPMSQGSPQVPSAPGIGPGNPILGQQ
jgi:hypothetical protein